MLDSRDERPAVGLGEALSGLAATVIATLRTRVELATVEFDEQRERTKIVLVLVVVATVFFCFALVALSALVVLAFWGSYPLAALGGIVLFHAAVGAVALFLLKRNAFPRPFEATLQQLQRDAEAIKNRP
ncbi:MAG TPA: phage holin family protein [Casimicrobiaceae bacterium]|nr:phage holin family protein [Casimicrobiaceae bacterium]